MFETRSSAALLCSLLILSSGPGFAADQPAAGAPPQGQRDATAPVAPDRKGLLGRLERNYKPRTVPPPTPHRGSAWDGCGCA